MEPKRVVICDDHEIVRDALRARIAAAPGLDCVGEAEDGISVIDLVTGLSPDLLIIDIEMPESDGISAIESILAVDPSVKVLIFTAHGGPNVIDLAIRTGVAGYLPKSSSAAEVETAASAVLAGGSYFPEQPVAATPEDPDELERLRLLSARERQILDLLATGMRAQGVAAELGIQAATVYTHVRNITLKLGVETRTQAVALATRYSFLNPGPHRPSEGTHPASSVRTSPR